MEKVIKRFDMGVGYAYNMAGRWIGIGALHPKKNQACKRLTGMALLMRKFRFKKVRIVVEVLEDKADQVTMPHDCTATCVNDCTVCGGRLSHIMVDVVAPEPEETPGPGTIGTMLRWDFETRDDGVWACRGEHHRSSDHEWFKLDAKETRWYQTYLAHGARS